MTILLNLILLTAGFVLLIKGADWFVDGAAGIAGRLGISQLVIGLTIVAMGTSAPETAVSLSSALKGDADICIGNVVGSNIMNVLIILGATSVITTLQVARSTIRYEIPFMIAVSALLLGLGFTGNTVNLFEGVILLVCFGIYLAYLFQMARQGSDQTEQEETKKRSIGRLLLLILVGMACIIYGSDLTVDSARTIAQILGVSERIIGLTIVALGTSLPELVTSVTAARKGSADIAIGNIVGSNIFNILLVVGTTAVITPVSYQPEFMIDGLVMVGAALLLFLGVLRKQTLTRGLGIVMILCYSGYLVYLIR